MSDLDTFRARLDQLDEQIARLLGERFQTCREIADYKSKHDVPMMQPDRVKHVRARYLERGGELDIPLDFIEAFFELLIDATCKMEDELIEATSATTQDGAR
jgi:4-amino-4-deoxychorismate mutase